jgi:ferredoxin
MKIIHRKDKCMGCLACVSACDKYFESDKDDIAHLKGSQKNSQTGDYELEIDATKEDRQNLEDAESVCPIHIISLEG